MSWIFFALLAPAVYTVVNFIDKHVVSNEVKDYKGMVIYGTIMGLVVGTFFWIVTGFPTLPLQDTLIILSAGALTIWASALYFKAVSMEDASKIIILFQTMPIFVLILSIFLLKETVSALQIFGFFLILGSAIGIAIEKGQEKFKLSKTFWLVMAVNLLWALSAVMAKFAIQATSFSSILAYESWGLGIGGTLLFIFFPQIRNSFLESVRTVPKRALFLMFTNEGVFVLAKSITFYAYSIGPASLVSVLGSTQVLFGVLYGYILTTLLPKYFKEDVKKETIVQKLLWGVLFLVVIFFVGK